uniref:(California timema) hypothetical protein n=1 Tax=Timema californicum TaxID=61474 RepID=A0A7R9PEJ4_TIMCA|nr:unnamed protein product [Timema californicum]
MASSPRLDLTLSPRITLTSWKTLSPTTRITP